MEYMMEIDLNLGRLGFFMFKIKMLNFKLFVAFATSSNVVEIDDLI